MTKQDFLDQQAEAISSINKAIKVLNNLEDYLLEDHEEALNNLYDAQQSLKMCLRDTQNADMSDFVEEEEDEDDIPF